MNPGTQLGSYEILSPLGKGGMGEVWCAKDSKLGREVAIKTLPEEFPKTKNGWPGLNGKPSCWHP